MINIVFCDDNEEFLKFFKGEIKSQFQAVSEGEPFSAEESFTNGKELLEYSDKNSIDVLFLDIDMPEMSGFEIAKVMNEKSNGKIIIVFMSAYDNFVYESFDYLPFAYMKKDSIATEIPKVVLRISEKLSSKKKQIKLLCDKTERVFLPFASVL